MITVNPEEFTMYYILDNTMQIDEAILECYDHL